MFIFKKIIKLLGISSLWIGFFLVIFFIYIYKTLPDIDQISNNEDVVTIRYSNGEIIKEYGKYETITYGDIPQHLIGALIITEDANFFQHHGFDTKAIFRAFFKNLFSGRIVQGGSTITQQLIKVSLLTPQKSYIRKLRELMLSIKIEQIFTKEQILTLYLNSVYFGEGNYGIAQASRNYFGKSVSELNFWQSIILVSIIKAPSTLSPKKNNPKTIERANNIMSNMTQDGYLSQKQIKNFNSNPKYKFTNSQHLYFANYVFYRYKKYIKNIKNIKNIKIDIDTTLDKKLQQKLNNSIQKNLSEHINISAITLNTHGDIVAMIGGKNYQENSFNISVNAKRQIGSIFKTFIFLAAFEQGWKIDDYIEDQKVKIQNWVPENYNDKYHGFITLIDAFALSVNSSAIYLLNKIDKKKFIQTLNKFNFDFDIDFSDSTIALGTIETNPLEIAKSYGVFANGGHIMPTNFINEIKNKSGNSLYKKSIAQKKIIDDDVLQKVRKILRANIMYGTGKNANVSNKKIYGKTGTTQGHRDAWFVGFDDKYITAIWSGKDTAKGKKISGGGLPARIFRDYYRSN
jgi:penicillin-binding protein 1A